TAGGYARRRNSSGKRSGQGQHVLGNAAVRGGSGRGQGAGAQEDRDGSRSVRAAFRRAPAGGGRQPGEPESRVGSAAQEGLPPGGGQRRPRGSGQAGGSGRRLRSNSDGRANARARRA